MRKPEDAESLAVAGSERLVPLTLDVTDPEQIAAAAERIEAEAGGGLHGLVNNAGIAIPGPLETLPIERLPPPGRGQPGRPGRRHPGDAAAIRSGHGRIVFISSIGGRVAFPLNGAYHAAKFGIEAVGDVFRRELRPWGISVSIVEPGTIDTPIWERGEREADEIEARAPTPSRSSTDRRSRTCAGSSSRPPPTASPRTRSLRRSSTPSPPNALAPVTWSASTPRSMPASPRWSRPAPSTASSPSCSTAEGENRGAWRLSVGMRHENATPDLAIAEIAKKQHGVVSREQLIDTGLGPSAIARRARAGRLHRIHRGVYAVGYARRTSMTLWMAAVLAGGAGAVLSHRSAAELWELLQIRPGPVEISIPAATGRARRSGIVVHRRASLTPAQTTQRHGIPVTVPAKTIADLHPIVTAPEHRRAIRQAEVLGLNAGPTAPPEPTRSELEHIFLQLCRSQRWPAPDVNVRVGSRVVDFLWRAERVVVETDGYRYHRGETAFEDDHARDVELRVLDYDLVRLSYRQVVHRSPVAIAAVEDALRKAHLREEST